jgi:prepilin-type N-terminal cleavage/methylation domain-containing protein
MRTGHWPSRRGGFTLIELLVVVSILAVLAALTLAGISRVRAGQHAQTTESTVKKLQVGLNQQMVTVLEDAWKRDNSHVQPVSSAIGEPDQERGRSFLAYAYTKRTFPMNFAEAKLTFGVGPSANIPSHPAFAQIPATSGLSADQQAAALLYIIVHDMSGRGTSIDADSALAGAETTLIDPNTGREYKVFKDAYGTHITFLRWYGANPAQVNYQMLQSAPYVNPNDVAANRSRDAFDKLGKLRMPAAQWGSPPMRGLTLQALNNQATIPLLDYDGLNKVITVVSAGADKTFNTDDDVYGFKLAQFGAKAN